MNFSDFLPKSKTGTVYRVMEDEYQLLFLQRRFLGLWFTILKSYSYKGIKSFLEFEGAVYNPDSGNWVKA